MKKEILVLTLWGFMTLETFQEIKRGKVHCEVETHFADTFRRGVYIYGNTKLSSNDSGGGGYQILKLQLPYLVG
jgi:hypothetical protein